MKQLPGQWREMYIFMQVPCMSCRPVGGNFWAQLASVKVIIQRQSKPSTVPLSMTLSITLLYNAQLFDILQYVFESRHLMA